VADIAIEDLLRAVINGHRMSRPEACPPELFALIDSMWHEDEDARPTFAALHDALQNQSSM